LDSNAASEKDMASKAHADVHADEKATDGRTAKLKIFRGDREGGQEVEYEIPLVEGMVVLDAVLAIQAHQASDLAVRWNCKAAHCGSCSAEINGKPKLCARRASRSTMGERYTSVPCRPSRS
jgi:succinate dehydrogenase / fumarate reductase, iron-sulfur subunit